MATRLDEDQQSNIDHTYNQGRGSYNPAQDLRNQETSQSYVDAGVDQAEAFANDPANASKNDVQDIQQREAGWNTNVSGYGGNKSQRGRKLTGANIKAIMKKRGVWGLLATLLLGGGVAGTLLLSPSLLLFHVTETFMNNFNDAHAKVSITTRNTIGRKIGNSFKPDKTNCGIVCKFNTMDETLVGQLEAEHFSVDKTDIGGGRYKVNSITFPDNGPVIDSQAKFNQVMDDPIHAARFTKVLNADTKPFITERFAEVIKAKLGVDKAFKLVGDTKEKFNESFRRAIGLPEKAPVVDPTKPQTDAEKLSENPRLAAVNEKISGASSRVGKLTGVAGIACAGKNVSNAITVSLKTAQLATVAAFAMTFFNASDKTKAEGIDPAVMTNLGNMLTTTETNKTNADGTPNDAYGVSATDSYGYKAAAYGDGGKAPKYAESNKIGASGVLAAFTYLPNMFIMNNDTARTAAVATCKGAASPLVQVATCLETIHPVAIGACLAAQVAISMGISLIIQAILPSVIKGVLEGNVAKLDENTKGAVAGDALSVGGAAIFGTHSASYGMKPGTTNEIKSYTKLANAVRQQDVAIAKINAKESPLDIYNKYSFLGSMAESFNLSAYAGKPITSVATMLASTIPHSLASIAAPQANAGTLMPLANNKADLYSVSDNCPELQAINVAADAHCMESYTASTDEINADSNDVLPYMINNHYIDDSGKVADTAQGKELQKYIDYCSQRTDPLGETSKSLEDAEVSGTSSDYEWYIGARCSSDDEEVSYFRKFIGLDMTNAMVDNKQPSNDASYAGLAPSGTSSGTTNANSGNVNVDGWSFPTTAGAPLVSPFGPRGGGFHTGVDLGVPSGSPFYATRDGVIQTRQYNVYTVNNDGGAWCPVLSQISDPIQKDIWITHTVNGQEYTSVYGHLSQFLKKTGDVVKAGDLIGYTGGSGCSSGPHVHFEIWKGRANPGVPGPGLLDPWPLINH